MIIGLLTDFPGRKRSSLLNLVGLSVLAGLATAAPLHATTVRSPDGHLVARVAAAPSGRLTFELRYRGNPVIEPSPLGVTLDQVDLGSQVRLGQATRTSGDSTYPWWGVHSVATNHYHGVVLAVTSVSNHQPFDLDLRVFNSGCAYRYRIPGTGERVISGEATAFVLPPQSEVYYQSNTSNYEGIYHHDPANAVPEGTRIGPPLSVVLPDGDGVAAITEAALFHYSGMTLRAGPPGSCRFDAAFVGDKSWTLDGPITTPWRVVLAGHDWNTLVNADVVHNLCPPPSPSLSHASWIHPGRAVWCWWSQGTGDLARQERYVGWAEKLGFEYNLVDAGWEKWKSGNQTKWDLIRELVDYGRRHHVKIWLWKHFSGLTDPHTRDDFFRHCQQAGVAGVKIDFMDSEAIHRIDFYFAALRDAARHHLMVNFHGADKPTGERRTWPNEMTREGIRGLEYNRSSALPPTHYATLPFTRYLAGVADFTPCTLNPTKLKGTTRALQLASTIVFTSPLMHWADTPTRYLESPAVDVIRQIPTCWDETLVLPGSRIGELAAFARRRGDEWFIGIINGGPARHYDLKLSFLEPGSHGATLVEDAPDGSNPLIVKKREVTPNQTLGLDLQAGGGFVAEIKP